MAEKKSHAENKPQSESKSQEIQVKQKQEVTPAAEHTRPSVIYTPLVDICENDREIILLADMPGVRSEDLKIDLRESTLTIVGDEASDEKPDECSVLREYGTGRYYRQFTISDKIDQGKIEASLSDGVLRLTLPKAETAKPRQISIKAS